MHSMTREIRPPADPSGPVARMGSQPIALAAGAFLVLIAGIALVVLTRAHSATPSEPDRAAATRLLQARAAQASEQLVERTRGLEVTQQESVDQLQVLQEQVQTMRRLLAAQQADTKRLSDQLAMLATSVDGLRESFASVQSAESPPASARNRSVRIRAHASHRARHGRRSRS